MYKSKHCFLIPHYPPQELQILKQDKADGSMATNILEDASFNELRAGDVIWHKTPGISTALIRGLGLTTGSARSSTKHFIIILQKDTQDLQLKCAVTTSSAGSDPRYILRGPDYLTGNEANRAHINAAKVVTIQHEGSLTERKVRLENVLLLWSC